MSIGKLNLAMKVRGLSSLEKLVLLIFADLEHSDFEYSFPSLKGVANLACCSEVHAREAIGSLLLKGLLLRLDERRFRVTAKGGSA